MYMIAHVYVHVLRINEDTCTVTLDTVTIRTVTVQILHLSSIMTIQDLEIDTSRARSTIRANVHVRRGGRG